jgi:hypothetical protein
MTTIHAFYWDFQNEQNNYKEMMQVAYQFGKQFHDEEREIEFVVTPGKKDDPLSASFIGVRFKQKENT